MSKKYILATDVGGTCTDTVVFSIGEEVVLGKALSTPPNFADGVLDSIASAAIKMQISMDELISQTQLFIHGSTVVDNAILTRGGAIVGLVTTEGFEDTLHITRGAYGRWAGLTEDRMKNMVKTERAESLVSRSQIIGVKERTDYKGQILRELDEFETTKLLKQLLASGVEAVAVSLLWSFYNPKNEKIIEELLKRIDPNIYCTLSSEISPTPGEYERTSTSVINAYAGAIAKNYIGSLENLLQDHGYRGPVMIMQGYGGLLPSDEASVRSIGMLECGPAAGVIGSKALGSLLNQPDIIATDMGGTTFKVSTIQDGKIEFAREPMIDRYHYSQPKIEVVSIGAGGGSIIWLEEDTNIPRVGPRSAGSKPGPVCYGLGGLEPTLTDVFMLIGYMDPDRFLGGSLILDKEKAREIFHKKIAMPLNLSVEEAAFGIYRIACAQITDLIRQITVERGLDPRDFVLHAFGGSCGMVCSMFGSELGVKEIVIPYTAAVNCAFGLISADIVHEYSVVKTLSIDTNPDNITNILQPLVTKANIQLSNEGFVDKDKEYEFFIDLRYLRQVHEVTTSVRGKLPITLETMNMLIEDFEISYEKKFGKGSAFREAGIEMTQYRLTARGKMQKPELTPFEARELSPTSAKIGQREVFVESLNRMQSVDIYDFDLLFPGMKIDGPAVIHTPITTVVVQSSQTAMIDQFKNITIQFSGEDIHEK